MVQHKKNHYLYALFVTTSADDYIISTCMYMLLYVYECVALSTPLLFMGLGMRLHCDLCGA